MTLRMVRSKPVDATVEVSETHIAIEGDDGWVNIPLNDLRTPMQILQTTRHMLSTRMCKPHTVCKFIDAAVARLM